MPKKRHAIPARLILFARGFSLVTLVSLNTFQLAHAHYVGAFIVGFLISAVWWQNTGMSARSTSKIDGVCYALGAATGTVCGLAVAQSFYGP